MPAAPIYKVIYTFIYLSDGAIVVFINNVASKVGGLPLVFVSPTYAPLAMTTAGGVLTSAMAAFALEETEENRLAVEAARAVIEGILRDMASYVESIAKGAKAVIISAGYGATNPSTTRLAAPAKSNGAALFNNGHTEQLGYKND